MAKKISQRKLISKRNITKIRSVRQLIVDRVKSLHWTAYRVAQAVEGKMTAQTVYDYLAEPQRTRINDEFVGHLLNALGMEIRPKPDSKPDSKPRSVR